MAIQWNDTKVDQFIQSLDSITNNIDIRGSLGTAGGRKFLKIDNGVVTTTTNESEACSKKMLAKTIDAIMKSGHLDQKSCNKINDAIDLIKSSTEAIKLKSDTIPIIGKIVKIMMQQLNKAIRALTPAPNAFYTGELKDGLYHGKGLLTIGNKSYNGVFKKGVFQKGMLSEYDKRKQEVKNSEGIFKDGRLYKGTYSVYVKAEVNETKTFEGTFDSKGKLDGPGKFTRSTSGNETTCKGVFEHGTFLYGTKKFATSQESEIHEGPFNSEGYLHGFGKKISTDGITTEGYFNKGKLEEKPRDNPPPHSRLNADETYTPAEYKKARETYEEYKRKHPAQFDYPKTKISSRLNADL